MISLIYFYTQEESIESYIYNSVAFRYLAANTHLNHDTITTFLKRFLSQHQSLFVEILMISKEADLLKVGKVSLDGTKVKANTSKCTSAIPLQEQLETEVETLMQKANEAYSIDENDGMSIPEKKTVLQ